MVYIPAGTKRQLWRLVLANDSSYLEVVDINNREIQHCIYTADVCVLAGGICITNRAQQKLVCIFYRTGVRVFFHFHTTVCDERYAYCSHLDVGYSADAEPV